MKKLLSKKLLLIPLSTLMLIGSVFSAIILPTQPVYAATSASECISEYDGERAKNPGENGVGGLPSTAAKELGKSDCRIYCEIDRSNNEIECSQEYAQSAPLIELVCDQSYSINCRSKVNLAYLKCENGGKVDDSRTGQKDYGSSAKCFQSEFNPGRGEVMPSRAALTKAFTDGKKAADDVEESNKGKCEEEGKVWEDGECVPPENEISCAIDGIGWIVCPTMNLLAKMNDRAFSFLSDNFLQLDAAELRDNKDLKNAWETFRTLANGAFVIAFLVIIYGQMTGRGN